MDLIALRTAFFTGVGFFAFFATGFFATGFFATGFFVFLPSSANGLDGRLGSDGPASAFFFAAGFFATGFFATGFAVVFLSAGFFAGAFFGAGVARLDRAAFTCIVRV